MAFRLRILPTAEEEVKSIAITLLEYGAHSATRFVDAYEKQLRLLASGVVDYGLSHIEALAQRGYHSCQVTSYVILYFYESDEVVVAHVFHQRQDYARLVEARACLAVIEKETSSED